MANLILAIIILFPFALTFLAYFLTNGLVTDMDFPEDDIQLNYFNEINLNSLYN